MPGGQRHGDPKPSSYGQERPERLIRLCFMYAERNKSGPSGPDCLHRLGLGYFKSTETSTLAPRVMVLNTGENSARALIRPTSFASALTRNLARISV